MPSACACSTSCRLACILSTAKIEVSVTSAPCWPTPRPRRAPLAGNRMLGESLGDLRRWPRRGDDGGRAHRGAAATDDDHALADVVKPPSLKLAGSAAGSDQFGASRLPRQRTAQPVCQAQEDGVESARICAIVTSLPMRSSCALARPVEDAHGSRHRAPRVACEIPRRSASCRRAGVPSKIVTAWPLSASGGGPQAGGVVADHRHRRAVLGFVKPSLSARAYSRGQGRPSSMPTKCRPRRG